MTKIMTSVCRNTLKIVAATTDQLDTFFRDNFLTEEDIETFPNDWKVINILSFNKACPIPISLMSAGYAECRSYAEKLWGTKWDAKDVDYKYNGNILVYTFNTAWYPPLGWMKIVANKYTNLTFRLESNDEIRCYEGGKLVLGQ